MNQDIPLLPGRNGRRVIGFFFGQKPVDLTTNVWNLSFVLRTFIYQTFYRYNPLRFEITFLRVTVSYHLEINMWIQRSCKFSSHSKINQKNRNKIVSSWAWMTRAPVLQFGVRRDLSSLESLMSFQSISNYSARGGLSFPAVNHYVQPLLARLAHILDIKPFSASMGNRVS